MAEDAKPIVSQWSNNPSSTTSPAPATPLPKEISYDPPLSNYGSWADDQVMEQEELEETQESDAELAQER